MQNRRGLVFIALALVFGLAAAWTAQRWSGGGVKPAAEPADTTPVVVARVDLSTASTVREAQLDTVEWPSEHLPKGVLRSLEAAAGRVTRRPVLAGEPLLETALFEEGTRGGLGAVIDVEHRAVSVKVDPVIGVAGFVQPGARVDVLATLRRVDRRRALPYSKVILQDVRVLAIDQKLEEGRGTDPETVNVVTLQVKPGQAQQLTYAAHEGNLQLALRTPGDDEVVETRSVNVADLLAGPKKPARRVARSRERVEVIRGSKVEVRTF